MEEARDWAFHLQHFQSILLEFDPIQTPDKLIMICYFWEGLKPSIKVEMEQQDWESMDFEEMVQRAVNAKAKAGLRSSTIVWKSDARCFRGYRLSHNTSSKVQTQGSKDFSRSEESKPKNPKPALSRDNAAEPAKKEDRKDKKKKLQNCRRERNKQIPATGDNTKVPKKKKKRRDPSEVTYFHCNKKGYYANNCTKPPKNWCQSQQPPCR